MGTNAIHNVFISVTYVHLCLLFFQMSTIIQKTNYKKN